MLYPLSCEASGSCSAGAAVDASRLPRKVNRTFSHLEREQRGVGAQSLPDLSTGFYSIPYYLTKRERRIAGVVCNCSTVEIQGNCQNYKIIQSSKGKRLKKPSKLLEGGSVSRETPCEL